MDRRGFLSCAASIAVAGGTGLAMAEVALPRYALAQWIAFTDRRINFTYPAFESALKAAGAPYQVFVHPGTQHGFHNDSTPRENDAAAKPSWTRTVAHFKKRLV